MSSALRGVRRSIAKQVKGRYACKFRFTVIYEYVDLQCTGLKPSNITVLWFRSHRSRTSKKPEVKACYLDPKTGSFMYDAVWSPPNTVELIVTLYKDSAGNFKKKDYFFVIETHVIDAERKKLAIFSCNMADFASPDTNEFDLEMEFKPQSKKVVQAKLGAKIKCEFIKQGSVYDDDMESNFSHVSETELKQRINELTDFSDDEDDKQESTKKINTRQSWNRFVDEMKTLEYQEYHIAMVGNPLAESLEDETQQEKVPETEHETPENTDEETPPDSPSNLSFLSKIKKTRVLSAVFEEDETEKDDSQTVVPPSPIPEEKPAQPIEELKFVFPDRQLTRAETLPDIHLAAENCSVQGSHRIKEWMIDVNSKKQEVTISKLEDENKQFREGNKVLGSEIIQLHKEKDELQSEICELQMLVEDLRMKISDLETKDQKREKEEIISKLNLSGANSQLQNKKAAQVRGWLCKRGIRGLTGRRWRRRWFATDTQGRLYYYKKTNNTHPRGFIDLDIIIAVQDKPPEEQDTNTARFDVVVPERVYELMAHDEEEKMRWINALDYLRHWRSRMTNTNGIGNTQL